jgi:energy-converting hydrogenase Eha subunit A
MESKRNKRLVIRVFIIGLAIAMLSYLFHPEIGQLSVMVNGEPIADPMVRFAAVPTFLIIMGLAVILTVLLFFGIGLFMFLGAGFIALMACVLMAPYIWPVLLIIFLIIALMSFTHDYKD